MKFWRTIITLALVAMLLPTAAMAKKICAVNEDLRSVDGFAMPAEMANDTSANVGNGFPWENSTFFFAQYRNQYLYTSAHISEIASVLSVISIESIHARSVSFTGANTNVYSQFANGDESFVDVGDAVTGSLTRTFAANTLTPGTNLHVGSDDGAGGVLTYGTETGPNGSLRSTCTTCPNGDLLDVPIDTTVANPDKLVDQTLNVGAGNAGAGVWDTAANSGNAAQRAFGSGSFVNPNFLTTAYGVDAFDFVWVFKGKAAPPAASVEQQIKEIIRLLLTPQGLRCSGLDLVADNGRIEDTPIDFPNGKDVDPIQPQVTSEGLVTGDEAVDGRRQAGFDL